MGVPVIEAPCEAEAQAASLAEGGKVYATATEDMDALTFRTPIQIRKMTFANASKAEVQQISYSKAIAGLGITHEQFVDLCILLGCDYCDTIRGIGPKTALKLIREHKDIETILDKIDREKYVVPESYEPMEARKRKLEEDQKRKAKEADTDDEDDSAAADKGEEKKEDEDEEELIPVYVEARRLFNHHEVLPNSEVDLKWTECQPEPLKKFLVDEMGFNPDRVQSSIEKLQKAHKSSTKPQARMDMFFKVKANPEADKKRAAKRKAEKEAEKAAKKKGKGGGKKK
jgi:flap endonuclease-1